MGTPSVSLAKPLGSHFPQVQCPSMTTKGCMYLDLGGPMAPGSSPLDARFSDWRTGTMCKERPDGPTTKDKQVWDANRCCQERFNVPSG
jgi:hypothetical protein